MTGRFTITALAAIGALVAGFSAQAAESNVSSLAWALAAGVGLSLMLSGAALRILAVVLAPIAAGGAVWAAQGGLWVTVAAFAVAGGAVLAMVWWGPGWAMRRRAARSSDLDPWKAMDEGLDPTAEQDVRA